MTDRDRVIKRLSAIINWFQFLAWCALWIWPIFADDQSQPWRIMFSISCMVHAWDRAFTTKSPKEGVNGEKGGEVGWLTRKK